MALLRSGFLARVCAAGLLRPAAVLGAVVGVSKATVTTAPLPSGTIAARYDAIIFDKDGTLLDFGRTWDVAIHEAIVASAPSDAKQQSAIASALGFDLERGTTVVDAPVVHKSNTELVALLAPLTDGQALIDACAARVIANVAAVPRANEVLEALAGAGIPAAVATNDDEKSARAQLAALGWLGGGDGGAAAPLLRAVVGCDSGHGSKPRPGPLLAAADALGVPPARCCMVGDAAADLRAAHAAGFGGAILVGPAAAVEQHADLADVWIRDLGELLESRDHGILRWSRKWRA